ncbi:hypothetical protein [Alsobacter sp. SYSU BS001988]
MTYNFQLRQTVRLVRPPALGKHGSVPNEYEIVRLLPADTSGEISYRVRSGLSELVVREYEIKA